MILLPIFPKYTLEKNILAHEIAGLSFLAHQLLSLQGEDVLAISDNDTVLKCAAQYGIPYLAVQMTNEKDSSDFLPSGTNASLEALHINGQIKPDTTVLVADYRFFPWGREYLLDAYRQYNNSKEAALISVSPTKDHPCQFLQPFQVQCVDILFLNSAYSQSKDILCYLEKGSTAIDAAGRVNLFSLSSSKIPFIDLGPVPPVSEQDTAVAALSLPDNSVVKYFFSRQTENGACSVQQNIFSLSPNSSKKIDYDSARFLLVEHEQEGVLFLRQTGIPANTVRRIFPLSASENNLTLSKKQPTSFRHPRGGQLVPALTFSNGKKPDAIIVATLVPTRGDSSDISVLLRTEENLWHCDPSSGGTVNSVTGEKITGRQNCPDVYQADRALSITSLQNFGRLNELVKRNEVSALVWSSDDHITVESHLDLLQVKALIMGNRNKTVPDSKGRDAHFSLKQFTCQLSREQDGSLV